MAEITVRQVLLRLDQQTPNDCPREEKLRWLTQAEDMVRREIMDTEPLEGSLTMDASLTAPVPYQDLYQRYAEAQLFYQRGELDRYNAAAASWNGIFNAYKDYVNRKGLGNRTVDHLKLC